MHSKIAGDDISCASTTSFSSTPADASQCTNQTCRSPTPSDMVATVEAVVCDFVDNSPTFQREVQHSSPLSIHERNVGVKETWPDTKICNQHVVDGSKDPIVETTFPPSPLSAKMRRLPPRDQNRCFHYRCTQFINGISVECIDYGTMGDWKVAIEASVIQSLIDGSSAGNDEL